MAYIIMNPFLLLNVSTEITFSMPQKIHFLNFVDLLNHHGKPDYDNLSYNYACSTFFLFMIKYLTLGEDEQRQLW